MKQKLCSEDTCTLCMACANACPKNAIYLDTNEYGYEKINIDENKCIDCGMCETVCSRRDEVKRSEPLTCYAAQAKDKTALAHSASGGAFQMLALTVLENGGVCYGCASLKDSDGFGAAHRRIDSISALNDILNSKYIPSIMGNAMEQAKADLEDGKTVLFSGVPCQIAGLKAYLGKEYDNLITADLICHGVTSKKLFNDYIRSLEQTEDITVSEYLFRDKSISWGTNFCYTYAPKAHPDKAETKHCPREASSYMHHYLSGNIFRENCYSCPYANTDRVSDFTLGDYWEIEMEHPEFTKGKDRISIRRGISCILVNSEKGRRLLPALEEKMVMKEVTLSSVTSHNGNLRAPSRRGKEREALLSAYRTDGYQKIENDYRDRIGKRMKLFFIKNTLKSHLPDWVRVLIYRTPTLRKIVFR